jgi:hypothetical protein
LSSAGKVAAETAGTANAGNVAAAIGMVTAPARMARRVDDFDISSGRTLRSFTQRVELTQASLRNAQEHVPDGADGIAGA